MQRKRCHFAILLILSGAGVSNLVDLARGAFTISCYFIAIFGFDTADNEPPKDFTDGVSTLAPLGVDRPNKYRSGHRRAAKSYDLDSWLRGFGRYVSEDPENLRGLFGKSWIERV